MIHIIELNFQHYLKNGTFEYDSKSWTFFDMTPIIEPWKIQRTDFPNSKNWTSFEKHDWKNFSPFFLILRNALNFFLGDDSKNWTLLTRLKDLRIFFFMTQRLQPFEHDSMNWASSLHDSKNWTFFGNLTQWIEPSARKDSKNWTPKDYLSPTTKPFCLWLGELGLFFSCWLKELNFFSKISLKNYWPFLTWLTELNSVLEHDSPNWTFFEEYDS